MRIPHTEIKSVLNKPLEKIYTIYGDEPLFIQRSIEKIRNKASEAGFTERKSIVITKDFDWSILENKSENIDMFSNKKILELKMLGIGPGISGGKAIKEYLKAPNDFQILIISAEGLDKRSSSSAWVKDLENQGTFITVLPLKNSEINQWIKQQAQKYEITITSDAASKLAEMTEGNLFATLQEIQKVSLIHPKTEIDFKKITNSIVNSSRYEIFDLTDAFITGNRKRTIKILEYFKMEGASELQILSLLSKELGNLFTLKTVGNVHNIYGPQFYKDRLKRAVKKLTLEDIEDGLLKIADIDASVKGHGHQDAWQGLRELSQLFFKRKTS